ncbi:hypothetical protein BTVI_69704 [Pitangus sulphuratus]|nr:hypothetical protein BTVI_69704 [Pitangus sulphuratus]
MAPHSLVSPANMLRVHSVSLSTSPTKMLNSASLNTDPRGTSLVTGLHLDFETFQFHHPAIPSPARGPPIKSMSLQFRDKDVMQDSAKCFVQVQGDDISYFNIIHQCCNPALEGHQICQTKFALSEAILAVANDLLIFHVP